MPASFSFLIPWPETKGLGSTTPMTIFFIPELIIFSVHGGVLPVWLQGSKVQKRVRSSFLMSGSTLSIQFTSAWGPPKYSCAPDDTIFPFV